LLVQEKPLVQQETTSFLWTNDILKCFEKQQYYLNMIDDAL